MSKLSELVVPVPSDINDLTAAGIDDGQLVGRSDGRFVGVTGGGASIVSLTYAELVSAIGAGTLIPGQLYEISDFATVHYIVDGNGTSYSTAVVEQYTFAISGTVGTMLVTCGEELSAVLTYDTDAPTTCSDFVTANAALYAAQSITLSTDGNGNLIFAGIAADVSFDAPVFTSLTGDESASQTGFVPAAEPQVITGATEPLIVCALSVNTIAEQAYSPAYPQDKISYDWNPANWLNDKAFAAGAGSGSPTIISNFRGVITFRHDTLLDNYAGFDWRNCKFRRWDTNAPAWDGTVAYSVGQTVTYDNQILQALGSVPVVTPQAEIDTLALSGTSGDAYVSAGGVQETATFDGTLAQTASDFVTSYAAAYLAAGITLTTDGDGNLVFTANVAGIANNVDVWNSDGDLSGSITVNQPNISVPTPTNNYPWVVLFNLNDWIYWLSNPTSEYGVPAGAGYVDLSLFAEGSGNAIYEKQCRGNHVESTLDDAVNNESIGTRLSNNVFVLVNSPYYQTWGNVLLPYCANNLFISSSNNNVLGSGSSGNIFDNARQNTLAQFCWNNLLGTAICNALGIDCQQNVIQGSNNLLGSQCQVNVMWGNSCVLGVQCTSNVIGNSGSPALADVLGAVCSSNVCCPAWAEFQSNTLAPGVSSVDFTGATVVAQSQSKEIYIRPDGAVRLRYYDNNDQLVVVAANA
jgi:hypothetical protein